MKVDNQIEIKLVKAEQRSELITSISNLSFKVEPKHLGKILSEIHNNGKINLLSSENIKSISNLGNNDFWMIVDPLIVSIPNLKSRYQKIQFFVEALVNKAGNDLAATMPYQSFIEWCKLNPDEAKKIILAAKKRNTDSMRSAVFAIHGLGEFQNIVDFLNCKEPNLREIGFKALGFWNNISDVNTQIGIEHCLTAIQDREEKITRKVAIEAAFRLWEKEGKTSKSLQADFINCLLKEPTDDDLVLLCALLYYCPKASTAHTIKKILQASKQIGTNFDSALQWIEKALTWRDGRWSFPEAVDFFETLIPKLESPPTYDRFRNFCKWAMMDSECSSFLFSRWLNKGNIKLCNFLTELVEMEFENNPAIAVQKKDLPETTDDQIFLAKKCIGFLWFYPITAASILLSLIKNGNKDVYEYVEELLWYPLLLSYSGELKTYLEEQKRNRSKRIKTAVSTLLDRHSEYLKGLEQAREINELEPSVEKRRAATLKGLQRNYEIQKESLEQSVLKPPLSQTSTLLYGNQCFTMVADVKGMKYPDICPLREITFNVELPKLSVIDPAGLNQLLVVFRAEKNKQ